MSLARVLAAFVRGRKSLKAKIKARRRFADRRRAETLRFHLGAAKHLKRIIPGCGCSASGCNALPAAPFPLQQDRLDDRLGDPSSRGGAMLKRARALDVDDVISAMRRGAGLHFEYSKWFLTTVARSAIGWHGRRLKILTWSRSTTRYSPAKPRNPSGMSSKKVMNMIIRTFENRAAEIVLEQDECPDPMNVAI